MAIHEPPRVPNRRFDLLQGARGGPATTAGRYELLFDTMLQGVVFQDASGKILSVNPAGERILGRTEAELRSQTSEGLEGETVREGGSPFPGAEHPSMVALRTGHEQRGVVMGVFNPREKDYRWISISAVPIFRPGESTPHQVYTLFTVYGIVKQAGGHVAVHSEVGQGSVFRVYLPRTDEPQGTGEGPGAVGALVHETGDALLVEDEEQVRTLTARMLRHLGFRVLEASDGEEALRVSAGKAVDLVVTDTVMPHMGGEELAARIRSERPGTKVLLVSGYTERGDALQGALVDGTAFLQKPYTLAALAHKIRDLLHPRRNGS